VENLWTCENLGASAASRDDQPAGHMRRFAVLATLAFVVAACSPEGEATGSITKCAAKLYPAYNPKVMDQCVAVCKKCDRGTPTTCIAGICLTAQPGAYCAECRRRRRRRQFQRGAKPNHPRTTFIKWIIRSSARGTGSWLPISTLPSNSTRTTPRLTLCGFSTCIS
jgi:hypothetical protein